MTGIDERYGAGTLQRLGDVIDLCRRAELLAARGREWYDSDPELAVPKLAAESLLLKLGEAVSRLPVALLDGHRHVTAWRRAIGMRHRLAHEYDAVDHELVWGVISTHAAEFRRHVEELVATDP